MLAKLSLNLSSMELAQISSIGSKELVQLSSGSYSRELAQLKAHLEGSKELSSSFFIRGQNCPKACLIGSKELAQLSLRFSSIVCMALGWLTTIGPSVLP